LYTRHADVEPDDEELEDEKLEGGLDAEEPSEPTPMHVLMNGQSCFYWKIMVSAIEHEVDFVKSSVELTKSVSEKIFAEGSCTSPARANRSTPMVELIFTPAVCLPLQTPLLSASA
jgi:hypothetical protein